MSVVRVREQRKKQVCSNLVDMLAQGDGERLAGDGGDLGDGLVQAVGHGVAARGLVTGPSLRE